MDKVFLLAGVVLAGTIIAWAVQVRSLQLRIGAAVLAVLVLCAFFTLASFRFVDANSIGLVTKNIGLVSLPSGKIIATEGEKGWQATTLAPGWHPWYWPFIYKIDMEGLTTVPAGSVGLLNAKDGQPLPRDTTYAPEWNEDNKGRMSDAEFFLGEGGGYKGPQTSVLNPATYRINTRLFELKIVPVTTVEKASVGVVKSNVGTRPIALEGEEDTSGQRRLVTRGQRGIWREPLLEGQYYLNTDAYQVTPISTKKHIIRYTAGEGQRTGDDEENEINVITSDGFDFPVDVRIVYEIEPRNAPLLVASVGDDQKGLRDVMNLAVRSIFRNNAQGVKALDYVKQRKQQEEQSLLMLADALNDIGVTVTSVRIGKVGDEKTLGSLLKTQKDREIALQEQETFKVQQLAAEQKKQLTKTEQEAEEEKRLATAAYEVQIAEQNKLQVVIAAEAEAEAVAIKAEAQAKAYMLIAEQIGSGNAALIELLKIVGENNISITPRVMVVGQGGGSQNGETTALIGTMLDTMMQDPPKK